MKHTLIAKSVVASLALLCTVAHAETCSQLQSQYGLSYSHLTSTIRKVTPNTPAAASTANGGLGFAMWLTLIDGSGKVCAVTNSLDGTTGNSDVTHDIWLGSRVISAQKANTANAFSQVHLSLSTANLFTAVQPGNSLFGLQESNPVDATVAYQGSVNTFGTAEDPLVGVRIGGVNVFGGGLALYNTAGAKIGAIGVSGDTSCTDHVTAWKVRDALGLSPVAPGTKGPTFDQMIQSLTPTDNQVFAGFEHPKCLNNPTSAQSAGAIYGN